MKRWSTRSDSSSCSSIRGAFDDPARSGVQRRARAVRAAHSPSAPLPDGGQSLHHARRGSRQNGLRGRADAGCGASIRSVTPPSASKRLGRRADWHTRGTRSGSFERFWLNHAPLRGRREYLVTMGSGFESPRRLGCLSKNVLVSRRPAVSTSAPTSTKRATTKPSPPMRRLPRNRFKQTGQEQGLTGASRRRRTRRCCSRPSAQVGERRHRDAAFRGAVLDERAHDLLGRLHGSRFGPALPVAPAAASV